jgi:predicted nucleotidyltransferase
MLKNKSDELTTRYGVKSLFLFGSVARNEDTAESDVDLLVEFSRPAGYLLSKNISKRCWVAGLTWVRRRV